MEKIKRKEKNGKKLIGINILLYSIYGNYGYLLSN